MFNWLKENKNKLVGIATTVGVKAAKVGVTSYFKAGAKAIPYIGNAIGAIDDIYQDIKIGNLQDTTAALKDSQSVLQGKMKEVQIGLEKGQAKQSELSAELTKVKKQLNNATSLTFSQIRDLELQQQFLDKAMEANQVSISQMEEANKTFNLQLKELENQQQFFKDAISCLQDDSLDKEQKIARINEISEQQEKKLEEVFSQLENFEQKIDSLEEKTRGLHENLESIFEKHEELEKKVKENSAKLDSVDNELEELKKQIKDLAFQQKKDKEKLDALHRYAQLKEEKLRLEKELNDYLGVPTELPPAVSKNLNKPPKLFELNISNEITPDLLTRVPQEHEGEIHLLPVVYDYYLNKFGEETMKGWIRSEYGEFSKDELVEHLLSQIEENFKENSFSKEQILKKKELFDKLKANLLTLNEIAQFLNLETYALNQKYFENPVSLPEIGSKASTAIPWLFIIIFVFFFFLFASNSNSNNNNNQNEQTNNW